LLVFGIHDMTMGDGRVLFLGDRLRDRGLSIQPVKGNALGHRDIVAGLVIQGTLHPVESRGHLAVEQSSHLSVAGVALIEPGSLAIQVPLLNGLGELAAPIPGR
jgi:hypothetical protein